MTYLVLDSQLRTETDEAVIANLRRKGWADAPPKPSDAATWQNGQWVGPSPAELAAAARSTARAALRAQYMALPPYIRGPMMREFIAANQLLDMGLDADAASIVEYAEPPKKFNQAKLDEFEAARQAFATAIAALPPFS